MADAVILWIGTIDESLKHPLPFTNANTILVAFDAEGKKLMASEFGFAW